MLAGSRGGSVKVFDLTSQSRACTRTRARECAARALTPSRSHAHAGGAPRRGHGRGLPPVCAGGVQRQRGHERAGVGRAHEAITDGVSRTFHAHPANQVLTRRQMGGVGRRRRRREGAWWRWGWVGGGTRSCRRTVSDLGLDSRQAYSPVRRTHGQHHRDRLPPGRVRARNQQRRQNRAWARVRACVRVCTASPVRLQVKCWDLEQFDLISSTPPVCSHTRVRAHTHTRTHTHSRTRLPIPAGPHTSSLPRLFPRHRRLGVVGHTGRAESACAVARAPNSGADGGSRPPPLLTTPCSCGTGSLFRAWTA